MMPAPFEAMRQICKIPSSQQLNPDLDSLWARAEMRPAWLSPRELGDSNAPLGGPYNEPDTDAQACEKIDQGVDAVQVDAPTHKLADAGLRDAEEFRCLCLFQPACRDGLLQLDHQIPTHLQFFV